MKQKAGTLQQHKNYANGAWVEAETIPCYPSKRPMWKRILGVLGLFIGIGWNTE